MKKLFETIILSQILLCFVFFSHSLGAFLDGVPLTKDQPDGTEVDVLVFSDEFYGYMEDLNGYVLIRDEKTDWLCYAKIGKGLEGYVSTGAIANGPHPAGIFPYTYLDEETFNLIHDQIMNEQMGLEKFSNPNVPTVGQVTGLAVLVEFSDKPTSWTTQELDRMLNLPGYNENQCEGSVRDYFLDSSTGAFDYSNDVIPLVLTLEHEYDYYNAQISGGSPLIGQEVVAWLNDTIGVDFTDYDSDGNGIVDGISIFHSEYFRTRGALHPRYNPSLYENVDGIIADYYMLSSLKGGSRLSFACHENGHMLFVWPDLYGGPTNNYCLMGNSLGHSPKEPNPYFKIGVGWVTPVTIFDTGFPVKLPYHLYDETPDPDVVYKLSSPTETGEYYLVENRQEFKWDTYLAGNGVLIWRIDESLSTKWRQYVVQADGLYELENNGPANQGDFFTGDTFSEFDFSTSPPAIWPRTNTGYSAQMAGFHIAQISSSGKNMEITFDSPVSAVSIVPKPISLNAPWTLIGPDGFQVEGEGAYWKSCVPRPGYYTVVWGPVAGYSPVQPDSTAYVGPPGKDTVAFSVDYIVGGNKSLSAPEVMTKLRAHPNPFNPSTSISFALVENQYVEVAIYGIDGRLVNTLHSGLMSPGEKSIIWNGENSSGGLASSGKYFGVVTTEHFTREVGLTLIK